MLRPPHEAELTQTQLTAKEPPLATDEDRSPDYCFTCGRRCGSKPHS